MTRSDDLYGERIKHVVTLVLLSVLVLRFRPHALTGHGPDAVAQAARCRCDQCEHGRELRREGQCHREFRFVDFAVFASRPRIPPILAPSALTREPDWTDCDIAHGDDIPPPTERRVTFYESPFIWVTGYEVSDYWLRHDVPVRIGDRVEHNLTMVQIWVFVRGKAEQVVVFYPTDGIWRIHPLPPPNLAWTSYGSSFFVGPVERKERPVVEIKEITFDPASQSFRLAFADGGPGKVKLGEVDDNHIALDICFDQAVEDQPFAALRSMYVTEFNADVARIALQRPEAKAWLEEKIMASTARKRRRPGWDVFCLRAIISARRTSCLAGSPGRT